LTKVRMSSGRPRSFITAALTRRTGASAIRPFFTLFGTKPSSAALTKRFIFGACAARLKMSRTSPTRWPTGSTR